MARVDRCRHGRAEIDIAEAEHEVAGREDDLFDVANVVQPIDTADELDVARAPRRIGPDALHVLADRQLRRLVVPGQRQMDDARRHLHLFNRRQIGLRVDDELEQPLERDDAAIEMYLQRANARREIDDAVDRGRLEPLHQRVGAKAQVEIEHQWAVLDEQILIATWSIRHLDGARASWDAAQNRIRHPLPLRIAANRGDWEGVAGAIPMRN